jgi:hypothetical protein
MNKQGKTNIETDAEEYQDIIDAVCGKGAALVTWEQSFEIHDRILKRREQNDSRNYTRQD